MGKARFLFWLFLPACASFDCQSYCYPLQIWHFVNLPAPETLIHETDVRRGCFHQK